MKPVALIVVVLMFSVVVSGTENKEGKDRREVTIKGRILRRGDRDPSLTNIFEDLFEIELDRRYSPDKSSGHIVKLRGLDRDWAKTYFASLHSRVEVTVIGFLKGQEFWLKNGCNPQVSKLRRRIATDDKGVTVGSRRVLVIHVRARDVSTTNSLKEVRDNVFGTDGDSLNLVERYGACSFGQLRIKPFQGKTRKGVHIHKGTISIKIPIRTKNSDESAVRNAVVAAAAKRLGDLQQQFDFVMICVPPGTRGTWSAYGYVDHWLSVYNDKWCSSVSAQVHEIGHNLNLSHSGTEKHSYGDRVGFMGFSYKNDEAPKMCFNPSKSWQLGWYASKQKAINPLTTSWNGHLVGVCDYERAKDDQLVILKLRNGKDSYYIGFNREAGINVGTQDARNMVTVHQQGRTGPSLLMARLKPGQSYSLKDLNGSSETVAVKVNSIRRNDGLPWYADVTVDVQTITITSRQRSPTATLEEARKSLALRNKNKA